MNCNVIAHLYSNLYQNLYIYIYIYIYMFLLFLFLLIFQYKHYPSVATTTFCYIRTITGRQYLRKNLFIL